MDKCCKKLQHSFNSSTIVPPKPRIAKGDSAATNHYWNALPLGQKNWINFQMHFEREHRALKEIRGATIQSTGYHQANYLAEQVLQEVRSV